MLGTLGTSEMIFIFILALVLFGPKKLPEIGRTIGKAITEFRRASNELKTTLTGKSGLGTGNKTVGSHRPVSARYVQLRLLVV